MGVRKEGVTLVDSGGAGAAVSITDPLGQDTMANSVAVVIASDQTPIPITGSVSVVIPDTAANTDPVYATDDAVTVASRDTVASGQSLFTKPNLLLPIAGITEGNQFRSIPLVYAPWALDSDGARRLPVVDLGPAFATGAVVLNALNAVLQGVTRANSIQTALITIANTGSFIGTLTPTIWGSDGVAQSTIAFSCATGGVVTDITTPGNYLIACPRTVYAGCKVTAYTSGSITTHLFGTNQASANFSAITAISPIVVKPKFTTITQNLLDTQYLTIADVSDYASVAVQGNFSISETLATLAFQGSVNGTDWYNVALTGLNSEALNPGVTDYNHTTVLVSPFFAGTQSIWSGSIAGLKSFRVQYNNSGTGFNVNLTVNLSAFPYQKQGSVAIVGSSSPNGLFVSNTVPSSSDIGAAVRQIGMPAEAALADTTVNPTLTKIQVFPSLYNGVTWDRAPGNSVDGALVNLGANNDVGAKVTGNPPLYTEGSINSLSQTLQGGLRVEIQEDEVYKYYQRLEENENCLAVLTLQANVLLNERYSGSRYAQIELR